MAYIASSMTPSFIVITLFAYSIISSSCVTINVVMPNSDVSSRINFITSLDRFESRLAVGSSANKIDRKSTRLNSSHVSISYAVFCLKKKRHKSYDVQCICNIIDAKHDDNNVDA